MAVSISLMFGRLGGVAGSNTVAFLLDNQCETSFYLGGSLLLGNIRRALRFIVFISSIYSIPKESDFIVFSLSSAAMSALAFFIPKKHPNYSHSSEVRPKNDCENVTTHI